MKLVPRIDCHTQSEIDYSIFEAIAIPFAKTEETSALEIGNSKLASQISKHFGLDPVSQRLAFTMAGCNWQSR